MPTLKGTEASLCCVQGLVFSSQCLYFPYCMAGHLPGRPRVSSHLHVRVWLGRRRPRDRVAGQQGIQVFCPRRHYMPLFRGSCCLGSSRSCPGKARVSQADFAALRLPDAAHSKSRGRDPPPATTGRLAVLRGSDPSPQLLQGVPGAGCFSTDTVSPSESISEMDRVRLPQRRAR